MKDLSTVIYKLVHDPQFRHQLQNDLHVSLSQHDIVLNDAELEAILEVLEMLQEGDEVELNQALKYSAPTDIFWPAIKPAHPVLRSV
ncbi:MAG: hypothetical protein GXP42_15540 [Chloroflexi bacterium]|nr:hypothetical protein [Chloroflexota bacterium]